MLQRLLAIIRKELITMLRDPRARFSLILPPIIQLFIFSSAATMEVKNIHLGVVDLDRGPYAAEVLQGLRGSRSFTALPEYPALAVARDALEREQVVGVLVLQSGFSADLAAGRPIKQQLHAGGPTGGAVRGEATLQHQDTDHLLALDGVAGHGERRIQRQRGKAARAAQALEQVGGVRPAVEIHHPEVDVLHFHGRGRREDEQLQDGRDDERVPRARIAQHGDELLPDDGQQPLQHRAPSLGYSASRPTPQAAAIARSSS